MAPDRRRVRFNVLGSLECWQDDQRVRLGGRLQERVLVTLLLEANRVVPVDRIIAAAWDAGPPATAVHQVRKSIADLRRRLPGGPELIQTDGPGYRVVLGEEQLDLLCFQRHLRLAREELGGDRTAAAVRELRSALALWRGRLLACDGTDVLEAAAAALEERRLMATEQLCALRLDLGDVSDLVGDLRELVAAHPLRETLRGQLMRALYLSGRQAEALTEYARVRAYLSEELGVDPSRELTRMHADILCQKVAVSG
ncbi:AfsR/SARP family transcriptional regulator [Streptomyces sp. NPDC049577]|uniref:AfsR/SARP family transcriptional regulator n=1 Tax=Streptomyces sp. NPDC049577 TaxID=3155153 RepID=UPI003422384F